MNILSALRRVTRLLTAFAALALTTAAHAANWATAPWTEDASTSISADGTLWAYHFGGSATATVNGVSVFGIASGNPGRANKFDITDIPNVFNNDTNALTALTGTGSAIIARDFLFNGARETVTLRGWLQG